MWIYTREIAAAADRNRTRFNLVNLAACGRIQINRLKDGEWYVNADNGGPIAGIFPSQVEAEKFREYLFDRLSDGTRTLDLRQWRPEDGIGALIVPRSPADKDELAGKETVLQPGRKTLVQRGAPGTGK